MNRYKIVKGLDLQNATWFQLLLPQRNKNNTSIPLTIRALIDTPLTTTKPQQSIKAIKIQSISKAKQLSLRATFF